MDILEMKENAAWERSDRERAEKLENWNLGKPIGTVVCGPTWVWKGEGDRKTIQDLTIYAKTTSKAYMHEGQAFVDVEGHKRLPIWNLFEPDGSSPALAVPCPVCGAPVGEYCRRYDDPENPRGFEKAEVQVIAHKKRRIP